MSGIWNRKSDGCDEDCGSDGASGICHAAWDQYGALAVTDEQIEGGALVMIALVQDSQASVKQSRKLSKETDFGQSTWKWPDGDSHSLRVV